MSCDIMEQSALLSATDQLRQRKSPRDVELLQLLLIEDSRVDACLIREFLTSADDALRANNR